LVQNYPILSNILSYYFLFVVNEFIFVLKSLITFSRLFNNQIVYLIIY